METAAPQRAILRRRRQPAVPLLRPTVLLIRGCPRSGTTVVAATINESPDAALIYEYALDTLVTDLRVLLGYERETERRFALAPEGFTLTDAQAEAAYFNDYGDPPNPHFPTDERFGHIVTAVVEATVGKRDVRLIGSKTPGAVSDEREPLDPYFADIRYLFVVRNPMATINSMLNRRNLARIGADEWEIADAGAAIAEYRRSALALLSHVAAHPEACYVVRFEDLAARTTETIAGLERFLDIDLSGAGGAIVHDTLTKEILTFDERSRVAAAFPAAIDGWDRMELSGPGPRVAPALASLVETAVPGTRYAYTADSGGRTFLGAAWHPEEEGGVWSSRPRADLFFTVAHTGEYVLTLELSCYLVGPQTAKSVEIELDGTRLFAGLAIAAESEIIDATPAGTVHVFRAPGPRTVVCGPIALEAGAVHRLVLATDDVRSPDKLGIPGDVRPLGLYLQAFQLGKAAAPKALHSGNGKP